MLAAAERLMMLPDLFGYWLTGTLVTEQTIASTGQLFDVRQRRVGGRRDRASSACRVDCSTDDVVPPGTTVGPLRPGAIDGADWAW